METDMETIFEALRKDHDLQRSLLDKIVKTSGDTESRKTLYAELKHALVEHASAEERYFYVPLIESDLTQEKSRHSIAEHHQIDKFIDTLDNTDHSSPEWLKTAKELQHKVLHHLEEEEREVFQLAGKVLSDKQKKDLAKEYNEAMETE